MEYLFQWRPVFSVISKNTRGARKVGCKFFKYCGMCRRKRQGGQVQMRSAVYNSGGESSNEALDVPNGAADIRMLSMTL